MLVQILLLILFLFLIFGYFGSMLYLKIKDFKYGFLFWILFVVTFLTVIEIIFCFIMFFKYKNKEGSIGPRGYQGNPGPRGDKGKCDNNNCQINLVTLLLIKTIETNKKYKLTETEKQNIYDNIKKPENKCLIESLNKKQIQNMNNNLIIIIIMLIFLKQKQDIKKFRRVNTTLY